MEYLSLFSELNAKCKNPLQWHLLNKFIDASLTTQWGIDFAFLWEFNEDYEGYSTNLAGIRISDRVNLRYCDIYIERKFTVTIGGKESNFLPLLLIVCKDFQNNEIIHAPFFGPDFSRDMLPSTNSNYRETILTFLSIEELHGFSK